MCRYSGKLKQNKPWKSAPRHIRVKQLAQNQTTEEARQKIPPLYIYPREKKLTFTQIPVYECL